MRYCSDWSAHRVRRAISITMNRRWRNGGRPAALCGLYLAAAACGQTVPPEEQSEHLPTTRGAAMYSEVKELIRQNRINEAIETVRRARQESPESYEIKRCYVEVHTSLADRMIQAEGYLMADRLINEALAVVPDDRGALLLQQQLAELRQGIPRRIAEAHAQLEVEWFEPAYVALRQARALTAQPDSEWTQMFVAAAIGAGDDQYLVQEFQEAFKRYHAVVQLVRRKEVPEAVLRPCVAQALQSMVLRVADETDLHNYDNARWGSIVEAMKGLGSVLSNSKGRLPAAAAQLAGLSEWMFYGLSFERGGDAAKAREKYGEVAHEMRPLGDVLAARRLAADSLRKHYTPSVAQQRVEGVRQPDADWQEVRSEHFILRHRSRAAAPRVVQALEFHFARVARELGRRTEDVRWAVPCEVFLYPNAEGIPRELRHPAAALSAHAIEAEGGRLRSQAMHVTLADPLLFSVRLPYEIAHVMVAALTDYRPSPAALREGIAVSVEPEFSRRVLQRLAPVKSQRHAIVELLKRADFHAGNDAAFTAEAYALVQTLCVRGTLGDVVDACRAKDVIGGLPGAMHFDNLALLENYWRGVTTLPATTTAP